MREAVQISAVIPAYNAEPFLQRSLGSALAQTCRPAEIIVVDDGSTDRTAKIVESHGDTVKYLCQENGGGAAALNAGIAAARGPWVAILDADDEWRQRHLENAACVLAAHTELSWYGAPVDQYDEASKTLLFKYDPRGRKTLVDNAYFPDYLSACPPEGFFAQPTMVIHKRVFETVGCFDVRKRSGYDLNMWFRIGLRFPEIGYCHEPGANVYKRADSVTGLTVLDVGKTLAFWWELEKLAESAGPEARSRAEPRIVYRAVLLLKGCIGARDSGGIAAVTEAYGRRLPLKWRLLGRLCRAACAWRGRALATEERG